MKIIYLALIELEVYNASRTHTIEVCNNLTKLGHNVLLLCPRLYKERFNFTFDVVYLPFFGFGFIRELIYHLIEIFYLIYFILKFKPDVIYERESINLFSVIISKIFLKKHFIEVNGWLTGEMGTSRVIIKIYQLIQLLSFKLSTGIITVSEGLKDKIEQEYNIKNKVTVIYNGVDIDSFKPMDKIETRKKLNLDLNKFYIGYVGTISKIYDFKTLFYAFKKVLEKNKNIILLIVGTGPMLNYYKKLADELNITKNIIFQDQCEHQIIPLYINSVDIWILPISKERLKLQKGLWSIKLYEYLSCAKPVIATELKENISYELLQDKLFTVEPENIDEFANSILTLVNNQELQDKLGKKAREFVVNNFTWLNTAKKIIEHIEKF